MTIDDILEAAERDYDLAIGIHVNPTDLWKLHQIVDRANLAPKLAAEVLRLRERENVLTDGLRRILESGAAKFKGEYNHVQIAKDTLSIPSPTHESENDADREMERSRP